MHHADILTRTSMYAKTNGLSPLPVCTCNEVAMTKLGDGERDRTYAAYCQVHMPFAAAKTGVFGTSHSESQVEEATRRMRLVYLEEKAKEEKQRAKQMQIDARRKNTHPARQLRADEYDEEWDLTEVSKNLSRRGGPPILVPNPHIERSKERLSKLREAHGYQIFETRNNYLIVTNDRSQSFYRLAKIERFSDEFRIDEDPHLYSQLQMQNVLKMAALGQQGCKRISKGHGIVGFIQMYNFESTSDTGMDLDAMNSSHGDIIRLTEEIYRRHIWAMKRRELMFSFLERTVTAQGVPAYMSQLGSFQGYTLFSGSDVVRPIGKYGVKVHARPNLDTLIQDLLSAKDHPAQDEKAKDETEQRDAANDHQITKEEIPAPAPPKTSNWFQRVLDNIDQAVEQQESAERSKNAKKLGLDPEQVAAQEEERRRKEEEAAAAELARQDGSWMKLILEGFMMPEIPTNNALPGQVIQIGTNKFMYRTKYLTIFKELDPSEDESDPLPESLPAAFEDSDSDSSVKDEKVKAKGKKAKVEANAKREAPTTVEASDNKEVPAKDSQPNAQDKVVHFPEPIEEQTQDNDPPVDDLTLIKKLSLKTGSKFSAQIHESDHITTAKRAGERSSSMAPKSPKTSTETPKEKQPQKENAVAINSKMYPEDYASDSDPDALIDDDGSDFFSDESSDSDDDVHTEFVEYTLIERILIWLGFLVDTQAQQDESDSEEEPAAGFLTRMYSGVKHATSGVTAKMGKAAAKKTVKATSIKKKGSVAYKKKKTVTDEDGKARRLTPEEIKAAVEKRKAALEAREQRQALRAEKRAKREEARRKAQARIDRYKFDPEQDIIKLRFKSFGAHAPLLL